MSDAAGHNDTPGQQLRKAAHEKRERKLRALRRKHRSLWFGLGTFGTVGWAVAIPTVIGVIVGIWLDSRVTGTGTTISWTLTFLIIGVIAGCLNAWFWVRRERREIHREEEPGDDA